MSWVGHKPLTKKEWLAALAMYKANNHSNSYLREIFGMLEDDDTPCSVTTVCDLIVKTNLKKLPTNYVDYGKDTKHVNWLCANVSNMNLFYNEAKWIAKQFFDDSPAALNVAMASITIANSNNG